MQGVGILYNVLVCFTTSITSLTVFFLLRKRRKEKEVKYSQGIDYFCLFLGLLWLFVSLGAFFVWLGYLELDVQAFQWFSGPLIYLHLLPVFHYFGQIFFKGKKICPFFVGAFYIVTALILFAFFKGGVVAGEITYWGRDVKSNALANEIFSYAIFVPGFLCVLIDFFRRIGQWKKTNILIEKQLFGFSFGLLLYCLFGIFDATGLAQGWILLFSRIGIMLVPLIFYLSATWETD